MLTSGLAGLDRRAPEYDDGHGIDTMSEDGEKSELIGGRDDPAANVPEAEALSDLWADRRRSVQPIDFPERRSGQDRRMLANKVPKNRRGSVIRWSVAKSGKFHALLLMAGDLVAFAVAFVLAFGMTLLLEGEEGWHKLVLLFQDTWMLAYHLRILQFLVASLVAVGGFWIYGHYSRRRPFWDELHDTTKLLLIFACVEATVTFAVGWNLPRVWLLGTWGVAIFLIPLSRFLIKLMLKHKGFWSKPTVIIGTGKNARDTAAALDHEVGLGFNVSVFLVPPASWTHKEDLHGEFPNGIEVNGRRVPVRRLGEQPERALLALGRPNIIVALESDDLLEVSKLLLDKHLPYSSLNIAPSMRGLPLVGMETLHFFKHDVMVLRVQNNLARVIPQRIKRLFDLSVAVTLLVGLFPLLLFLTLAIRRSGPGVFFGHTRIGQNGQKFKCYKFRTMVPNAQEVLEKLLASDPAARAEWDRDFKLRNDPRVTPVGAFLRKTSLDELPQLWNVVKGEMSLVGPRPVTEAELNKYADKKDFFLEAKPGMTGLWQVSGRNDVTYEERVQLDAWYARNWQLWYDIVILMKTVRVVFGDKSAY